jgi:hypothetical protein
VWEKFLFGSESERNGSCMLLKHDSDLQLPLLPAQYFLFETQAGFVLELGLQDWALHTWSYKAGPLKHLLITFSLSFQIQKTCLKEAKILEFIANNIPMWMIL